MVQECEVFGAPLPGGGHGVGMFAAPLQDNVQVVQQGALGTLPPPPPPPPPLVSPAMPAGWVSGSGSEASVVGVDSAVPTSILY